MDYKELVLLILAQTVISFSRSNFCTIGIKQLLVYVHVNVCLELQGYEEWQNVRKQQEEAYEVPYIRKI